MPAIPAGHFQYTTMRKEMPLQNALFLLIPVSYVAGWTLSKIIGHGPGFTIWPCPIYLEGG
jgi:hypothetical protein